MTTLKTAAALAFAALALSPAAAAAQEVVLRVHHFLTADSPLEVGILQPWEKAIEEQSGGRIDIQRYPSMQLGGKPPQLFDQARDGIVDVAWTLLSYTPGRFPIAEVFELPFMGGTSTQTTMALQEFQAKHLGKELEQVHPLLIHAPAAYKIHTKTKPVAGLADLAGMKIRAPSRQMTEALNALGATAVGMPVPEVAQALTTGVIDGAVIPWEVFGSLRIESVAKDHTEMGVENGGMSTSVIALVMNKARYDSLPDDLKKVIDDNSGANLAPLAGKALDDAKAAERQKAIDAGGTIHVIPEADVAAWKEKTRPVFDAWVKAATDAGHDGQAILNDARAALVAAGAK